MKRRRWVAAAIGLVLVAIVGVVWVIPAVSGPAVECIDIDPVACDAAWRDALSRLNTHGDYDWTALLPLVRYEWNMNAHRSNSSGAEAS